MGFAGPYLQKQRSFLPAVEANPHDDLQLIVVIPCYNDPGITETLNSLYSCIRPASAVEVLVIVNTSADADKDILNLNDTVYESLIRWKKNNDSEKIRLWPIRKTELPAKYFGAGLARKIGMDEAVYRFNLLNNNNGIIISLDADTLCAENYLVEIEKQYNKFPETEGCSIYFEHPLEGNDFDKKVYETVCRYELYLRYYKQALNLTGFPFSYHTIGSAFAVRAGAYVKYGGMNRRKGGEDFYFIHKITPHGKYRELNSTSVFPSPRPSDRVPFGTGHVVKKQMEDNEELKTYCLEAFIDLKELFCKADKLYKTESNEITKFLAGLNKPLEEFLLSINFQQKISEINNNVASGESFLNSFFQKFNAFFVVKYMNFVHMDYFDKVSVISAANNLLFEMGIIRSDLTDALSLLEVYRKLDRV
jgi:hypothetical protein